MFNFGRDLAARNCMVNADFTVKIGGEASSVVCIVCLLDNLNVFPSFDRFWNDS